VKRNTERNPPFLDKKGTIGAMGAPDGGASPALSPNKRRHQRIAALRRENLRFADALDARHRGRVLEGFESGGVEGGNDAAATHPKVAKLIGHLRACSSTSMFRQFASDSSLGYLASHTCKNRLCQICNSERKRRLRSRYWRYFEENPKLLEEFDAMHLTLTVPHTSEGWRGQRVYIKELGAAFNAMRKMRFWKQMVHAGEMTVEFTKREQGLHIHVHAVLLVHSVTRSRNKLFAEVLEAWNGMTIDGARTDTWTDERMAGIRKSVGHLSEAEFEGLVGRMDPRGSTLVGLRSLYVTSEVEKPGYRYDADLGRWIRYCRSGNPRDLSAGIMEGLKYHFEPLALKDAEGRWDVDLVHELAPVLYGQRLYRKLGAFHGVKELNIQDVSGPAEVEEMVENAGDVVVHPETGVEARRAEYRYLVADVAAAVVDPVDGRMVMRGPARLVEAETLAAALRAMVSGAIAAAVLKRNKLRKHGLYRNFGQLRPRAEAP
jgi:hypothetical protein